MKEIVRYELSGDRVGLLAYFEDGSFYHIHSDELTRLERSKWELLIHSAELESELDKAFSVESA